MESHLFNRLKYLRQNFNYLSEKEQAELDELEGQYKAEQYKLRNPEYSRVADEEDFSDFGFNQEEVVDFDQTPSFSKADRNQLYSHFENEEYEGNDEEYNEEADYEQPVRRSQRFSRLQSINEKRSSVVSQDEIQERPKKSKYKANGKKRHHCFRNLLIFLVFLLIGGTVAAAFIVNDVQNTLKKTYVKTNTKSGIDPSKPLTIVLLGVDTGDATRGGSGSWNGNSDSQIVMTLNPKTNTTTMISLERDTLAPILDQNGSQVSQQKLNAAYPFGYNNGGLAMGAEYAMNTLSAQAGIPINNFVVMNMDGLVNLVNDVGGINVVNDSGGTDALQGTTAGQTVTLPTGENVASGAIYISDAEPNYTAYVPYYSDYRSQLINGEQALVFARDRHTLANGDYGRAAHQREVISALFKKLLTINTALKYHKVLTDISGDFKTNLQIDAGSMLSLLAYKSCFNKVVSVQYQGVSATAAGSDGVYASYQLIPNDVAMAVQNFMRRAASESILSSLSKNVVTYESYTGQNAQYYAMPSVTVTEKGKSPAIYGVDSDGSFVSINASNAKNYVATTGSAAQSQ